MSHASSQTTIKELATCLSCGGVLAADSSCGPCGRAYPVRDDILDAIGELKGRNQVVATFYDGSGWPRFRKWERLFLTCQGGARRARMSILRHVLSIDRPDARVLEVGIGDGENIPYLPSSWSIHGVDIARTQLVACQERFPRLRKHLAWAEGEHLPFADDTFDACYSVGGFTHYGDQAAALREMRRVTRSGGPVVVADESPRLHRLGIGHLIGFPAIDAFWLRKLGLDRDFVDMVLGHEFDVSELANEVLPGSRILPIWNRLGYCLVHQESKPTTGIRN
ncbi:MAG: methylase [Planctomycetes bacterium SCN 63-9]|nr:MAG: methylase [Planctomycetes bacterium SCN 63-9]